MELLLSLYIDESPRPSSQPRPRIVYRTGSTQAHGYNPTAYTQRKTTIQRLIIEANGNYRVTPDGTSTFALEIDFYIKGGFRHDLDKLVGTYMDALQGLIYVDDVQVVALNLRKINGEKSSYTHLRIYRISAKGL